MAKIGLDLTVTCRKNVRTSMAADWEYKNIDEYLDFVEYDKKLKKNSDLIYKRINPIQEIIESSEEGIDDYNIVPQNLFEPFKTEYRALKTSLPVVNFFGKFRPPSTKISLEGEGNGIVVLDIDIKHLGGEDGIPSAFMELLWDQIHDFFYRHPSTIFLYETTSRLGYHMGYLTDARNGMEYKQVFSELVEQLANQIKVLRKPGAIDESVGHFKSNFFTNHSNTVLRKRPDESFKLSALTQVGPPIEESQEQQVYDEFPYAADFRLFLAYHRRSNTSYFDDRNPWVTMMFALKAEYSICYKRRIETWFERLSSLSPKFREREDKILFNDILEVESEKGAGINFIIKVLNEGKVPNHVIKYDLQDVQRYFDDLSDCDEVGSNASNFLFIDKYLSELQDTLDFTKNLVIESPPNTGKSTLFLKNVSFKRIYLVPTKILLVDLNKMVKDAQIVQEGVHPDDILPKNVILSTYEGLNKIIGSNINLEEYTLIVDEAHNIFLSASPSFRFLILHRICTSFEKFKNFILLSGTWINLPFCKMDFTLIKVKQTTPIVTKLEVVTTETPLENLSKDVISERGKQIVLINNKNENKTLKELVLYNRADAIITLMNSDTKNKEDVKKVLEDNHLEQGQILVGTQMIVEGISFLDQDIKAIRFYRGMGPEQIAQLGFRARKSRFKPPIQFYQKRMEFFLRADWNLSTIYNRLFEEAKTKKWNDLASQYVQNSAIRIGSYRSFSVDNDKYKDVETPWIMDANIHPEPYISEVLLGYFSLKVSMEAMSGDLFSLLAALRKWNFTYIFTNADKVTVREDFKKLQTEKQKEIIGERMNELADLSFEDISQNKKSPLFNALVLLRCLGLSYFNQLNKNRRIDLFFNKKELRRFCDLIQGYAILHNKEFLSLADLVSPTFYQTDVKVLSTIKSIKGYPKKISNKSLVELETSKFTKGDIKKILKRHFTVSNAKPQKDENGASVRYFSLREIHHGFESYLNIAYMTDYQKDLPF